MGQLLGTDPRNTSHGASLAAHDRTRHGLPTGKGAKGSRRLRLRLV